MTYGHTPKDEIGIYNRALDTVLIPAMRGDMGPFEQHIRTYELNMPENPLARKCAIYKTVTARTSMPMKLRTKAKKWLLKNGWKSWDDGDVPT